MQDVRTPEQKQRWRIAINVAWGIVIIACMFVGLMTILRWIWEAVKH